jgi:TonB family protein
MTPKLPLVAFVTILFSFLPARAQSGPQSWLRYTVKGEEFSVTLPAEPEMKTSDVFVPRLQKSRLERLLEARAGGVVYRIYVYENPKPRQSLKDFIAEQTAKSELDLAFERDLTVARFAGQQYSSHDRDLPATEQYFATEGRFYRFTVRGATADHTDASQFFSSVTLGKKQEGIQVTESTGVPAPGIGPGILVGKDVDTKPRLISKPEPSYTDTAKRNQVIGTVVLKVVFSSSGKVTNIRLMQGLPDGLTERAIDAAKKIRFIPATKEGKYVSMWMQLEYNFNLY